MNTKPELISVLKKHADGFHPVVPFDERNDKLLPFDFTAANAELTDDILNDTKLFTQYIVEQLRKAGARYGIGGYGEHRTIYKRSALFGPHPQPFPQRGKGAAGAQPLPDENVEGHGEFYQEADAMMYGLLKTFVAQHRSRPTSAEDLLWQELRGGKLDGYGFRRQHIIGSYIADFVCLAKKLIIEVDGLQHQLPDNLASDEERTLWLNLKGYEVIRFINNEVLFNTHKTLATIRKKLYELPFAPKKTFTKQSASSQSGPRAAASLPPLGEGSGIEARRLHLGTDIWGLPYTKVMAPFDGIVHSFGFHPALGDYGAVIILSHNLDDISFHTLYGHLSLGSIKNLHEGDVIKKGDVFAGFGIPQENGQWPPHLHFQVMQDMQGWKGDYPGVCAFSEKEQWLQNCIDPDFILGLNRFT